MDTKKKETLFSWKSEYKPYVVGVVIVAILGIFSNIMLLFKLPEISGKSIMVAVLSVMLYTSVIQYAFKYYVGGDKKQDISPMLIRFAGSMVGSLIAVRYGSTVIFMSLAIIMLLVPYMAGDITKIKRCVFIAIAVLILTIVVAVVRVVTIAQVRDYLSGNIQYDLFFYIDECNQMIQWILFCVLYFMRVNEVKKSQK